MKNISNEQIRFIHEQLKLSGVHSEELRTDLADHICCLIEADDEPTSAKHICALLHHSEPKDLQQCNIKPQDCYIKPEIS